ncbi:hypothetical protein [Nakamurella sp.]|uniref:hypothetical protein n=1 Tax=Nakamurella sp. TaxID=1869182 RepID=UPI0037835A09
MDLAAITPISIARADPEPIDDAEAGTDGRRAEAAAVYRTAKAAGRPEQAARRAARKVLPGFIPERTAV